VNKISGLFKGSAWLAIGNTLAKLATAISLPILSRFLTPEFLGVYSVVILMSQSGFTLSTLGIDVTLQRDGAQYETLGSESVGRLFGVGLSLICLFSTITSVGIWIFRYPIAQHWLGKPEMAAWLGVSALLLLLQPFSDIPLLFLSSLRDFRSYSLRSSMEVIFTSITTVLFAQRWGIKGAVLGLIVAAIVKIPWSYVVVKPALNSKGIKLRLDKFWDKSVSILKFGFPYYFGKTMLITLVSLPLMGLVSKYAGLEELGYLRVAQSMTQIAGFIPVAIAPVAMSYLSASSVDDDNSYQYLKSVNLRAVWILLLLPISGLSLILPDVIHFLFGDSYKQAVVLSWLYLWVVLIMGIGDVLIQYLVVAGKTVRVSWVSSVSIIVWVSTAVLLVPDYSGWGFLLSQGISQIVRVLLVIYPATASITVEDKKLLRNLLYVSVASLAVSFSSFFVFNIDSSNRLLSYSLSLTAIILLGIVLFKNALYIDEKTKLIKMLKIVNCFNW
jgi:O-antigen/teichoic acid export membrane protein